MSWRGILITGVSAAGKTTLAQALSDRDDSFEQVRAVTTRGPRGDDRPGSFAYLTEAEFDTLEASDELVIRAEYRGKRYGITRAHLTDTLDRGKVPVLVITPLSLREYLQRTAGEACFFSVFVDAPDTVLDERLARRGGSPRREDVLRQRTEDRLHREVADYLLCNVDLEQSLSQVLERFRA